MRSEQLSPQLAQLPEQDSLIGLAPFPDFFLGSIAAFGKRIRPKILSQPKVLKEREYWMYFPLLKLHGWGKRLGEGRRRNGAMLP